MFFSPGRGVVQFRAVGIVGKTRLGSVGFILSAYKFCHYVGILGMCSLLHGESSLSNFN